jgi:hypothetical protein
MNIKYGVRLIYRGLTSSVLGSMRGIKTTNLAALALDELNKSRKEELAAAGGFRRLGVLTSTLGKLTIVHGPALA